jgi:PAT family beta-lactamase induction signal transducer AmpG
MSSEQHSEGRHPATWVPTVYFAEGLPFYAVTLLALTFYQRMGVSVTKIALFTSLLGLPWTLKPLWSPFLEMYKTKKFFVILMQLLGGITTGALALTLTLPGFLQISLVLFSIIAFASATHDIATDGLYIAALSPKQQAEYAGWQGGFFNVGKFFSLGGLIYLAGYLTDKFTRAGSASPIVHAWMIIFGMLGGMLVLLALYHSRMLPSGGEERDEEGILSVLREKQPTENTSALRRTLLQIREAAVRISLENMPKEDCGARRLAIRFLAFVDVLFTFFMKPHIWLFMIFILLYRTGEGQVVKIGPLFLQAARDQGGLGLSLQKFGIIYGTFGTLSFIAGSVLGGYFVSWLGLKRALIWLLLALNLPMAAYLYLSIALPTSVTLATIAMSVEMFGYGFGFVGVILLMYQEIAPGRYQMAHYAFANSLMNLGLILPGAVSGWIQGKLGYRNFFVWVLISTIPALVMTRFIPVGSGEKKTEESAAAQA